MEVELIECLYCEQHYKKDLVVELYDEDEWKALCLMCLRCYMDDRNISDSEDLESPISCVYRNSSEDDIPLMGLPIIEQH